MDVNKVKAHYKVKTNVELAKKLGMTAANVTYWAQNGIPYERQCVLYFESKHKLKPQKIETGNV